MAGLVMHIIKIFCVTYFWHSWLSSILKIVSSTPDPGLIKFPANSTGVVDSPRCYLYDIRFHYKFSFNNIRYI